MTQLRDNEHDEPLIHIIRFRLIMTYPTLTPIVVAIIADDLLARTGLATLLEQDERLEMVAQLAPHADTIDDLDVFLPDVVVIDSGWSLDLLIGLVRDLHDQALPFILLVHDNDEDILSRLKSVLVNNVIFGLILRASELEMLLQSIQSTFAGLTVIDPLLWEKWQTSDEITATSTDAIMVNLTPREDEVLQLLAQGLTNKAIARQLEISENTIKFHVNAIMSKLNAQSRTDAVVRATRAGLLAL